MMFKGLVLTFSRLSKWLCTGFLSYSISKTGSSGSAARGKEPEGKKKINRTQQNNHLILYNWQRILRKKRHFLNYFPIKSHFQKLYKIESLIRTASRYQQDSSRLGCCIHSHHGTRDLEALWVAPVTHQSRESTGGSLSQISIHTANPWAQNRTHSLSDHWPRLLICDHCIFKDEFKYTWQFTRIMMASVCRCCLESKRLGDSANFLLLMNTHKTHKGQGERGQFTMHTFSPIFPFDITLA